MSKLSKFALFAAVAVVSASSSAGAMIALHSATPTLRAAKAETQQRLTIDEAAALSTSASIHKSKDGHFWASGDVGGASVRFLVDTGATEVALTPADAERLGFRPFDLDYGRRVITAGGASRAAAVTLSSVSVDGARLEDVDALVVERGLDVSLLGMSYLGRLARFEANREALVLQP